MNLNKQKSLNITIKTALLGVIAFVIMLLEFNVPFVPPFLHMDLSEVAVLLGAFSLGALPAVGIEFIKVVLNLLLHGTMTGGVGELANFIVGVFFVVPAALWYHRKKSIQNAIIGMLMGTASMAVMACVMNYFFILPLYAKLMPLDAIIQGAAAVNGLVKDYNTLILFVFLPFNLVKGILSMLLTLPIYKRLSPILHRGLHH